MSNTIDLFMEKFPLLGLMLNSFEEKELSKEKLPSIEFGKEEVFYFYGLSPDFYLQAKSWLKKEKQLVFLEDDLGVIASFLKHPLAEEILIHPHIHIELPHDLSALAQKFPVKRVEVAGFKSKKGLKKLNLELLEKTALSHALHMDRLHGYQPFQNFLKNLAHLPRSFYVNKLKGAFQNVPAVICGAGPSLDLSLETLSSLENKALIIAGGSTLAALSSKGIMPHFGMAIDPNLEEYRRLKNSFAFEVPLLYSTRVHPAIFRTANGPFGYMRSGIGGLLELWIEEELGLNEVMIGELLSQETISVTAICVAFAEFLGCNPILLNGIDMAYTGGVRYASGVDGEEKIAFDAIDREKSAADRIVRKKGVFSAIRWILESKSISDFAKKQNKIRFINTTAGGIGFEGIEYVPIEKVVKEFKEQKFDIFEKIASCQMPANTDKKIRSLMKQLKGSLKRLIEHLAILAEEKKGSAALAANEIEEEIAALYLFYDIRQILKPDLNFWKNWLELARKYLHQFSASPYS